MTKDAPASASISAETSPVCAPFLAEWQSWPPVRTLRPAKAWAREWSSVAGGQSATRAAGAAASTPAATSKA